MLILGHRATRGEYIETDEACPYCREKRSLVVQPCYNYYHILRFPVVPISKGVSIVCVACGRKFFVPYRKLNENFRVILKRPGWHYTGLFVILIFFIFLFIPSIFYFYLNGWR